MVSHGLLIKHDESLGLHRVRRCECYGVLGRSHGLMSSSGRGDDCVVTVSNQHDDLDLTVRVEIIVKSVRCETPCLPSSLTRTAIANKNQPCSRFNPDGNIVTAKVLPGVTFSVWGPSVQDVCHCLSYCRQRMRRLLQAVRSETNP